jgi:hypothetical protein
VRIALWEKKKMDEVSTDDPRVVRLHDWAGTREERARRAFRAVCRFEVPSHVTLLCVDWVSGQILNLNKGAVAAHDAAQHKMWVTIVEERVATREVRCTGGLSRGEFSLKRTMMARSVRLYGSDVKAGALFASDLRELELSAPVSLSGSVGMSASGYDVSRPPEDYDAQVEALRGAMGADAVERVLTMRYITLQNAGTMPEGDRDKHADQVVRDQLFRGIEPALYEAASVVGHWAVRLRLLPHAKPRARAWLLDREVRICALLHDARDEVALATIRGLGGRQVDWAYEHAEGFYSTLMPTDLFEVPYHRVVKCVAMHVETDIFCDLGQAVLTKAQVLQYCFPMWLRDCMEADTGTTTFGAQEPDAVSAALLRDLDAAMEQALAARSARHLPMREPPPDLPDIESLLAGGNLPPCMHEQAHNLERESRHLRHPERYSYAAFLRNLSYGEETVTGYFRHHFLEGGTSPGQFDAKYRSAARMPDRASEWEDGVRKIPFGYGCRRMIEHDVEKASGCKTGCPFSRAGVAPDDVKTLVYQMAPHAQADDVDDVAHRAAVEGDAQGACARVLEVVKGGLPRARWHAYSPSDWYHTARKM